MSELNAEQIKKALECCCGDIVECQKCAYVKNGYNRCKERAAQDALALINSQEQRIKELEAEYIKGYEQGVRDFAERLKKYYGALKGNTYSSLVSFNIDQQARALTEGVKTMFLLKIIRAYKTFDPLWLEQDGK